MFGWNEAAWISFLCGAALKGTLLLGAAWVVSFLLRGQSAAVRHLVWTAAAVALLALPLLSISVPALPVPVAHSMLPMIPIISFQAQGTGGAEAARPDRPPAPPRPGGRPAAPGGWRPDLPLWLIAVWAAGVAVALARILAAYAAMCRLRRSCRPYPNQGARQALAAALGIDSTVRVLETRRGGMPMSFGIFHPVIFLPSDAAEWTEERRRVVLLHEMAHVRRGDVATHMLARIALSLYWWNPLAWSAWRQFLRERERAADDLVLACGERASEYASHLLEVARSLQPTPATAWAAVGMARRSQLEGRLLAILDPAADRRSPGRLGLWVAALAAIAMAAPIAAVRAQSPASQTPPPDVRFRTVAPGQTQSNQDLSPDVQATVRTATAQRNPEMLDRAAAAFEALRQYDTALKLRQAALDLRAQVFGQQSKEYQAGLIALGDLAAKGKAPAPEKYYKDAVAIGDVPGTAGALVYLAMDAYSRKELDSAAGYLDRALRVAENGSETGRVLTWMAVVKQAQPGGAAEAESLYDQALAAEDPASPAAATTMELYASGVLRPAGRTAEADSMEERARAIRVAHVQGLSPKRTDSAPAVKIQPRSDSSVAPVLVSKVEPSYTEEARAMKVQGTVVLKVVVGTSGTAEDIQVVKGVGLGLDEAALDAISQWRFKPGMRGGQPVPVAAMIEVNFRLL
jgi:TonB family protein